MSHTYSRTKALLLDFATSFDAADIVVLHKIYASARETHDGSVDGRSLFEATKQHHGRVEYYEELFEAAPSILAMLRSGDIFITMGAGDNWRLGPHILAELQSRSKQSAFSGNSERLP